MICNSCGFEREPDSVSLTLCKRCAAIALRGAQSGSSEVEIVGIGALGILDGISIKSTQAKLDVALARIAELEREAKVYERATKNIAEELTTIHDFPDGEAWVDVFINDARAEIEKEEGK